jgi:hypothetical protein
MNFAVTNDVSDKIALAKTGKSRKRSNTSTPTKSTPSKSTPTKSPKGKKLPVLRVTTFLSSAWKDTELSDRVQYLEPFNVV